MGDVLRLGGKTLTRHAKRLSPAARAAARADRAFDARWGTDTSAQVTMSGLDFPVELQRLSHHYQASGAHMVEVVIAAAGVAPEKFTFIDYGCGKGRMVLLAAARFAAAIGVEYSPKLIAIAERNTQAFLARGGAEREPIFWKGNAAEFLPPGGDLFCYLYNSFGSEILNGCLVRLEEAKAAQASRRVLLAYVDPQHGPLVAGRGWSVLAEAPGLTIFEAPSARKP
ncbi:MAG: hypothetical protein A4S16_08225 [Proteobacteria bacterium SG_bin6]|nr:MAG: hypothetical protein A4S16_08225 [Proteobacteria bacterium SG_bin6]